MRIALRGAVLLVLLGLIAAATHPVSTRASVEWCEDDPIIEIGGQRVEIKVAVRDDPALVHQHVRGAHIKVYVPDDVRARLVRSNNPFFDEDVDFDSLDDVRWTSGDPIPVLVRVTFDSRVRLDARVDITYHGGAEHETGTTSSRIWSAFVLE